MMTEKKKGFDTGFFIKILHNNSTAIQTWKEVINNEVAGFVCCLSIFEIERLSLKGSIDRKTSESIINDINEWCTVLWLENTHVISQSAKISHGNGIPAIDSIIIASLLHAGVKTIYTTDTHFTMYKKKGIKIIKL